MIIGEIVEMLLIIRDTKGLTPLEDEAVIAACNLLSRLPRLQEAETITNVLTEFSPIKNVNTVLSEDNRG